MESDKADAISNTLNRILTDEELKPVIDDLEKKGYEGLVHLGTGHWGEVYRTKYISLNCDRAVKILLSRHLDNKEALNDFNKEIDILMRLDHNHLVNIYDKGEVNGKPYYIMEFVTSAKMMAYLEKNKHSLKANDYLEILNQITNVLGYIHFNNVVHFDIKSDNILVDSNLYNKGIKLTDFGLAICDYGKNSSTAKVKPDIYGPLPKSLEAYLGKKLPRAEFKPKHDLYYLGRMLEELPLDQYTKDCFDKRQAVVLKMIIDDLKSEKYKSVDELREKLHKLEPEYTPTGGIEELAAFVGGGNHQNIRLPPNEMVPVTNRVKKLIELPELQRLRRVRQLGPTSLIYPGANNTRFEHSLGAYKLAVEYLSNLTGDPHFDFNYNGRDYTSLLVAVLLEAIPFLVETLA